MTETPKNPPAYPCVSETSHMQEGMAMRQAYKIAALQGILGSYANPANDCAPLLKEDAHKITEASAMYADAMLAEDAEHAKKEDG